MSVLIIDFFFSKNLGKFFFLILNLGVSYVINIYIKTLSANWVINVFKITTISYFVSY